MIYRLWLDHADAAGAALIVAAAAVLAGYFLDRARRRTIRGLRATNRALQAGTRDAALVSARDAAQAAVARINADFDRSTAQALAITQPLGRTRLTESYLDRTVADVPSPYAPVFTRGGRD